MLFANPGDNAMRSRYSRVSKFRAAFMVVAWAVWLQSPVAAQPRSGLGEGSEAAFLDVDSSATKKLGAARELILNRRWKDAIDLLRQVAEAPAGQLVPLEPGRFVGVNMAVNTLLAAVPAEALAPYRDRIDPVARRWYEAGVTAGDDEDLQRVIDRGFHSSYTDLALLALGDRAFERGEFSRARAAWERLIPPFAAAPDAGEVVIPPLAYYPRPRVEVPLVQARLILSRICQREWARARRDLGLFRQWNANAEGTLAGRTGPLVEILESLIPETSSGPADLESTDEATFAGSAARTLALHEGVDVGTVRWAAPLDEVVVEVPDVVDPFERPFFFNRGARQRDPKKRTILATFPLIYDHVVFCCDQTRVFAFDLLAQDQARGAWDANQVLYELPDTPRIPGREARGRIGLPAHTVSIGGGRLFARLGRPVSPRGAAASFAGPPSTLVCLDLAREGALSWKISAEQFTDDIGNWVFDGAPVAHQGRVYVLLRKTAPQLTLHVVCLTQETGAVIWNRRLCHGLEQFGGEFDEVHEQLLTVADGRIFCCTNLGVVAALDAHDGALSWACTYPREEIDLLSSFHDRQRLGPNPCVYANGVVFAAPFDSNSVVAFDSESGLSLWKRNFPGTARQIVGVDGDRLIVAGDRLWGLIADTGEIAWSVGNEDPQASTQGRGVIAGGLVYWPRHDEILLVESSTGRRKRDIALTAQHDRPGGGNLALGEGFLVVAQANRLVVFWEYANRKRRLENEVEQQPLSALPRFRLGLHEETGGEIEAAAVHYSETLGMVKRDEQWSGRPLLAEIRNRLAPLAMARGRRALGQQSFETAASQFELASQLAPRRPQQAEALLAEADARLLDGDIDRAAELLHRLESDPDLRRLPVNQTEIATVGGLAGQ
ncbi:MAG: hypothetical protein EHM42_03205, partial [Planctomycetaceae bacterium]